MNLSFNPYSLKFITPLVTGSATFNTRSGWILKSYLREKLICSEIAPLPGFSIESQQEVFEWISKNDSIIKKKIFDIDWITDIPFASVRFGIDMLRLQILSVTDGKSLHSYLRDEAPNKVKVNGLISLLDPIQAEQKILDFIAKGVEVIKCKVGIKPAQEINLIRIFSEKYPSIHWRLDANQAFDVEHAIHFIQEFKGKSIQYFEQPVPAFNLNALKEVKTQTKIPIAADEDANSIDHIVKIIEQDAADVLILKPMLMGTHLEIQAVIDLINQAGKKYVFTTALESIVGRRLVATIAASLGQSESDHHGLSTGYLFENDLDFYDEVIHNGFYDLGTNRKNS